MLSDFLIPPLSLFTVMAIGFGLSRLWPVLGRTIIWAGILCLYLVSTPFVSGLLLDSLQWYEPVDVEGTDAGEADAIVVLAAGRRINSPEFGGETVGSLTLERLRYGARLHDLTGLPVLTSGGPLEDGLRPLSELMKDALEAEFKVPVRWVETLSENTAENAARTAELLKQDQVGSILLVTHAWHMPRAKAAFETVGLTVTPAPTAYTHFGGGFSPEDFIPRARDLVESAYAIHEWIGLFWYRFRGKADW